jgi:hypothetical protein
VLRSLVDRALSALRSALGTAPRRQPAVPHDGGRAAPAAVSPPAGFAYAGDFTGTAAVEYRPDPDGDPDPGEIVWTWVPYEEDHGQGKDRPVLIVGRVRGTLLALMLTSRDRVPANGRGGDPEYVDIGAGAWDPRRRPSEVRLDRVLQIDPAAVRREGAVLDRGRYERVAEGLRRRGWR